MEVMFYIIAGKFNPSNDDFPVKTLITKDKFADKYAQDCTNLLDQRDIFKIIDKIEPAITNGIECVPPRKDVKQALSQDFELVGINAGTKMGAGYAPVGVMNDVALHGTYPYVVWLDVTNEPNNADRFESIKKVAKVINSELSRFEVRTGTSAFLSEVCEH